MTEHDVDAANGTERYNASGAPEVTGTIGPNARGVDNGPPPDHFTAPEKIVNVARAVTSKPSADPKVSALLAVLTSGIGRRLVVDPALSLLPPLDQPDEWDAWLAMLVGCALELVSDGVVLDVDECQRNAGELLQALFEGA